MSDFAKRNKVDELRNRHCKNCPVDELCEQLNNCREYIAELEMKCNDLREELRNADLTIEQNRHAADKEALKKEIAYRYGMIEGLKYAIRHNRMRDGKVDK